MNFPMASKTGITIVSSYDPIHYMFKVYLDPVVTQRTGPTCAFTVKFWVRSYFRLSDLSWADSLYPSRYSS